MKRKKENCEGKWKCGFASMDPEKQREIARRGGKAAHVAGTAHEFTSEEAKKAGKLGGEKVSSNREHMSRIGKIGGSKRWSKKPVSEEPSNINGETSEKESR